VRTEISGFSKTPAEKSIPIDVVRDQLRGERNHAIEPWRASG
jgi:hypothetical protein